MSRLSPIGQSSHLEPAKAADSHASSSTWNKSGNPLATRVSSILSTSYSDADFRGTLTVIDGRGIKNDGNARRRLRLHLQREVIEKNGKVLDEFGLVSEQLKHIKITLDKLNGGYEQMERNVAPAHAETYPALTEASTLLEKRKGVERRRRIVETLRERFVLSEDEEWALTSTAEPVDDNFFSALIKAKKINQECEVLLGFEKQTLASDVLEKASKNIGLGYQKLHKWVQREFKSLDLENPQMNATMRKALTVLAARPSLFQNCLDFFAEARQRILSDTFFTALTGNKSDGAGTTAVKPIDMIAHDPLRYVGDMLAWVHSAAVSEREMLEVLFVADGEELAKGINSGRDGQLWRIIEDGEDEEFNALKALNNLVDRDVAGAARVLRQRVEQVIQSNEESILAYKLANLMRFYGVMLLKLLGPDSGLLSSIHSLEKEAMRQFRALLRDHIAAVRAEPQSIPSDLGPPLFLQDSLKQLQTILSTYETALSTSQDEGDTIDRVLAEAVDPFILDCEALASSMPSPRSSIYLINCRSAVSTCFAQSSLTSPRAGRLQTSINEVARQLSDSQLSFFREGSGLSTIIEALKQADHPTADVVSVSQLTAASSELDQFLPSAYIDALERLGDLNDSSLGRRITEEAAENFCADFELLEKHINCIDSMGGKEDDGLRSIFPRTAGEIRVLLS